MNVLDLRAFQNEQLIAELTEMLHRAFPGSDGYPTLEGARAEVLESLEEGRVSLVALDDDGHAGGWIGAIESYNGCAYEMHPLVVHEAWQGQGLGRRLVQELEERLRATQAVSIYLGTDDADYRTNLGGIDLYPEPLKHAERIESTNNHPVVFYRKMGYVVVGVLPDANGFGRPDIFMAKRIQRN